MAPRISPKTLQPHLPEGLASVVMFLLPFAVLVALAVLAAQFIPWD
jgi:hypothetical protein